MMLTPSVRRWFLVLAALGGALLACARAEVPFVVLTPQAATPMAVLVATVQPGDASLPAPTATSADAYPAPATETPVPPEAPSATPVVSAPPTDTATAEPNIPTDTPPPPTETAVPPTDTPVPTDTPAPTATSGAPEPQPIPGEASLIQSFTASAESGIVLGRPADMADGRPETWASLRGGNGRWLLDLGSAQNVTGVKLYAQKDGADPTTLLKIEISPDQQTWTTVFVGVGNCGVSTCTTLAQLQFTDIGWTSASAQYIRIYGGPFKFALGEIQVAVLP